MQKRYFFYTLAIHISSLTCFMCFASEPTPEVVAGLVTAVSSARYQLETKEALVPLDAYNTQCSLPDQKTVNTALVIQFLSNSSYA